jgi:hypothetical protein
MSTVLFLVVLACVGLVIFWYVKDSAQGGRGESGLLGMQTRTGAQKPEQGWRPSKAKRPWRTGSR